MKRVLIAVIVLLLLILVCVIGHQHFLKYMVLDRGVMENPEYAEESEYLEEPVMLDGDYTYVDNDALLQVICGTWNGDDGGYVLEIQPDGCIRLTLGGENLLEDQLQFVYLQPGYVFSTEFTLDSGLLQRADGTALGEISALCHENGENSGKILMEVTRPEGSIQRVEFSKTANDN